jgi:hypothetical protein
VPKSAPSPRVPHPSRVSKGGDSHVPSNGNQPLGELARKIAGILAGYYPEPVKRSILAAMCGLVDGGNFSSRLSEVRSAGLLEDPQRGLLKATEKCAQEYLGSFEPPRSTAEVVEIWDEKLGMVARQIVAKLIEANGEPIRRADLAASIGLIDGGNFSARLSEVRSAGLLVDPSRGYVAANKEALFLEAS